MSRKSKIRYSQSDINEAKRVIKNFNAKISYLEKKIEKLPKTDPMKKMVLPEKTSFKDFKDAILSRQDYKRELNSLKRFSVRGAEKQVYLPNNDNSLSLTKWQRTEMNRRAGIINRKRAIRREQIAEIEVTSRGEKLGYRKGDFGMKQIAEVELRDINAFTKTMSRADLIAKDRTLKLESSTAYWQTKEQRLQETYIKAIQDNYGTEKTKDIVDAIRGLDFGEFYKTFLAEDERFEIASPKFMSGTNQNTIDENLEALKTTWLPKAKST